MFRVRRLSWVVVPAVFSLLGCRSQEGENVDVPASILNLKKIYSAYLQSTNTNDRPPQNLDDLLPFLKKQGNPQGILRSPDDSENYVILWGVDVRKSEFGPVLAYEKTGKDGKRYVQLGRKTVHMTETELRDAPFPPGARNPFKPS